MQALTNNYTTTQTIAPTEASPRYTFLTGTTHSSVVIVYEDILGINYRIHGLLEEYSALKDNWDGDDAVAPYKKVIRFARFLTSLLEKHGQNIFHASPGPNGEISIDLRDSENIRSIEILIYSNRQKILFIPFDEVPSQEDFDLSQLGKYLEWLNNS